MIPFFKILFFFRSHCFRDDLDHQFFVDVENENPARGSVGQEGPETPEDHRNYRKSKNH